jgi:hypothetical protein
MKTLLLAALLCAGCTLPQVIYVDRPSYPDAAFWNQPVTQPWVVDPLPQHGSGMGFMCRDAINRGDSGAARNFC